MTYSFLPVGHTKFAPDSCFGLLKQKLRKTSVNDLNEIALTINKSANVNTAQLVGTEDGQVIVPTYNWQKLLSPFFRKFPSIKKWHKFIIYMDKKEHPVIKVQEYSDTPEFELFLMKDKLPDSMPDIIKPRGLSTDRQVYLYDKIRQYCSDSSKDRVCPKPDHPFVPEPFMQQTYNESDDEMHEPTPKRPKRTITCKKCGKTGHNARTCIN